MEDIWFSILVGFVAQLIDGSLGMAYGISASTLLLSTGAPPAVVSASVHAAEVFSTGASALSHHHFGNVDKNLFKKLTLAGIGGAILGALFISYVDEDSIKPYVSAYLLIMGIILVVKAFRPFPPTPVVQHVVPLGFFGAFCDATGGGGWGPIVASTLMARGNDPRKTVGTVNASEFLVTLAASLTFFATIGTHVLLPVVGLAIGGAFAAPLGAIVCRRAPIKPLLAVVGLLVIFLSLRTLMRYF